MTIPLYLAEMSPPRLRGRLTVINNAFITGGQFVAVLVDGAFATTPGGWRYMLGLAAIPAGVQLLGFLFLPESPRWLVSRHRLEKARAALLWVRGGADVEPELNSIRQSHQSSDASTSNRSSVWSDLRQSKGLRRALMVGAGLQLIQQLSGINTVSESARYGHRLSMLADRMRPCALGRQDSSHNGDVPQCTTVPPFCSKLASAVRQTPSGCLLPSVPATSCSRWLASP